VADCVSKGATVRTGGRECVELNEERGCFFQPTVITGVTSSMVGHMSLSVSLSVSIRPYHCTCPNQLPFQQEIFGPVLPMLVFDTEEEAIALANDTP
jgi:succinate-semialdehyde dehydrogenase/glutarate-semialdehyde dehydrogenase